MDCTAWIILLRIIPLRIIPQGIIPQGMDVFLIISHWHPFYLLLMHFPYCAGRNVGHNFPYEKGDVLRI